MIVCAIKDKFDKWESKERFKFPIPSDENYLAYWITTSQIYR